MATASVARTSAKRLLGIDAPDRSDSRPCREGFGDHVCSTAAATRAKNSMRSALRLGPVRIEPVGHDRYGRTLAIAHAGKTVLNCRMLSVPRVRYMVRYDNGGGSGVPAGSEAFGASLAIPCPRCAAQPGEYCPRQERYAGLHFQRADMVGGDGCAVAGGRPSIPRHGRRAGAYINLFILGAFYGAAARQTMSSNAGPPTASRLHPIRAR